MSSFDDAQRSWNSEVEREAVRLIEEGTPPFDAIEQARNIVTRRRRDAARARERLTPENGGANG